MSRWSFQDRNHLFTELKGNLVKRGLAIKRLIAGVLALLLLFPLMPPATVSASPGVRVTASLAQDYVPPGTANRGTFTITTDADDPPLNGFIFNLYTPYNCPVGGIWTASLVDVTGTSDPSLTTLALETPPEGARAYYRGTNINLNNPVNPGANIVIRMDITADASLPTPDGSYPVYWSYTASPEGNTTGQGDFIFPVGQQAPPPCPCTCPDVVTPTSSPKQVMTSALITGGILGGVSGGIAPTSWEDETPTPGYNLLGSAIDANGVVTRTITLWSFDNLCQLTLEQGSTARTEQGTPLSYINMLEMPEPPPPPEGANVIGLMYDFMPGGATFDPPAILRFSYNGLNIPEGIPEENLTIAWYDAEAGKWVKLEGRVDRDSRSIIAGVSHFTTFTVFGYMPGLAVFSLSLLTLSSSEVSIGESLTISVLVTNDGEAKGSYELILKLDSLPVDTRRLTLPGGVSEKVAFSLTGSITGSHVVSVGDLRGTFVVEAPPIPPQTPCLLPPAPQPALKPVSMWLIMGLAAVLVAATWMACYLLIRR